jgi:TonB family protein
MNEFQFDHLKNRRRLRLPRPILYVGVAIILLAFFSIKFFQRADDAGPVADVVPPESAVVSTPAQPVPDTMPAPPAADPAPATEENSEGILFLDGSGQRILPPRRISGQRPEIPPSLLRGGALDSPRVYVRVGKNGQVTDLKLVSSSGSDEVDRLVLDALGGYSFHPAITAGRPVEFSSVVTVPLRAAAEASPNS